jgi:molybdopterin molybdotransferase
MSTGLLSYAEAHALVASYSRALSHEPRSHERVALAAASGRVLAQSIAADQDQPPFARSTRDGFACRAGDASSHALMSVAGVTHAGEAPSGPLPQGAAWEIMTGAPVPAGADVVMMIEHVEREGEHVRLVTSRSIKVGENIVAQGAQARARDVLIPAGTRLGAGQIALGAACGYGEVDVYDKPRVAILTTGDELVPVEAEPGPGQIRNSNAAMLTALVAASGGEPQVLPSAADTAEALDHALKKAAEADLLLISGGVSAGKFDLVEPALERMGATFCFTGVRIQPGKPLVFGEVPRGKGRALSFFGLPGNPISSAATFLLFAAQVLGSLAGDDDIGPRFLVAQLAKPTDRKGKPGLTRFLPARCEFGAADSGFTQVETVPWQGSGDLPAFARANCFVVVPEAAGSLDAGTLVRILMI